MDRAVAKGGAVDAANDSTLPTSCNDANDNSSTPRSDRCDLNSTPCSDKDNGNHNTNCTPKPYDGRATGSPYFSPPRLQKRKRRNVGERLIRFENNDDDNEQDEEDNEEQRMFFNDKEEDTHGHIGLHDDDNQEGEDIHLVSILNLVVDHVMKPPSPLEPDEFRWMLEQQTRRENTDCDADDANVDLSQESNDDDNHDDEEDEIKVPVIRIFGPIIRGEGIHPPTQDCTPDQNHTHTGKQEHSSTDHDDIQGRKPLQHQSGCLHIHGAYPYMLARPVEAGPDGSSYFFQACNKVSRGESDDGDDDDGDDDDDGGGGEDCTTDDDEDVKALKYNTQIDWDNPDSVATLVDDLHYKLEMALRCSINPSSQRDEDQKQNNPVEKQERFIRQITVVNGRGFYTYCNGTVAPFLRVEYYNPSHRWRVKIMLERGFDMPMEQHPKQRMSSKGMESNVRQARYDGMNGVNMGDGDSEVLKFCCYEAHIPYTMQFFKDWNLAGMSWIKVGDVRFRMSYGHIAKKKNCTDRSNPHQLLVDQIPSHLHWVEKFDTKDQGRQSNHHEEFWTKKETSCDIEIDTTVANILNVKDVITEIPHDGMGKKEQGIHWRAVPSLREIWMEERRRMAHLLPPKDNFLSSEIQTPNESSEREQTRNKNTCHNEGSLPFTLSVKKGVPLPGSRLALQGAKRLFDSSPDLLASFRRALKDIVMRHDRVLEAVDRKLQMAYLRTDYQQREGKYQSSTLVNAKGRCEQSSQDDSFDPFEALIKKFQVDETVQYSQNSSTENGCTLLLSQQSASSTVPNFKVLSQSSSVHLPPPLLTQAELQEVKQELEFCIHQERGVLQEEYKREIDASTLTPYESDDNGAEDFWQEEENMEEDEFERCLMNLATQDPTYDSAPSNCTQKISKTDASEGDSCINPGTKIVGPSVTNAEEMSINSVVEIESASYHLSSRDSEGENDCKHQGYMSRRVQKCKSYINKGTIEPSALLSSYNEDNGPDKGGKTDDVEGKVERSSIEVGRGIESIDGSHSIDKELLGQESITPVEQNESLPSIIGSLENDLKRTERTPKIQMSLSSTSTPSIQGSGDMVELIFSPPIRRLCDPSKHRYPNETGKNTLWHPIAHQQNPVVSWLGYSQSQNSFRNIRYQLGRGFIEPVQRPPKHRHVRRWMIKKRNRDQIETFKQQEKNNKLGETVDKDTTGGLELDGNSRKLMTKQTNKKRRKRVVFADIARISTCTMHEVEEVHFESQDPLSQESEGPFYQEKNVNQCSEKKGKSLTSVNQIEDRTATRNVSTTAQTNYTDDGSSQQVNPLDGIGQQGGKLYVEGCGGLKTSNLAKNSVGNHPPTEITIMSIEVHVQTRSGKAGISDSSREISMKPDPTRDSIFAICYVYAIDPGGGEKITVQERGCIFVPTQNEISPHPSNTKDHTDGQLKMASKIGKTMGCSSSLKIEIVGSERNLLLRIAAVVQYRDPDALICWDTQNAGLGYLIERGLALGDKERSNLNGTCIDMVRLLGRTPKNKNVSSDSKHLFNEMEKTIESKQGDSKKPFEGSILGAEWDDRVGAGAGPSSIVGRLILNCWKIISDEVKHPNSSYQQAMVATVLNKRMPFHDDLILSSWYGREKGLQRWRVLKYRIMQAQANILLFDALDVIGRAGEAARLSGVELSQSFPGIRGSQYKVEGVLLRALQSLWSDERGEKKGKQHSLSADGSDSAASQSQSPWKLRRNFDRLGEKISSTNDSKHSGYFFYSPSKADCSNQEALECQAMTLEPQSGFHFDPIVVCDFTALYPSLVIAYNLCYSTCAGKLEYHSTRNEMRRQGQTTRKLGPFKYDELHTASVLKQHMKSLKHSDTETLDRAYCLPTGSLFVSEDVLKGVLPSVLDEILSTRAMLKKAAKEYKRVLPKPPVPVLRQLEARQLALKYVANVTYGYTSATFSGRSAMPLLADAIVESGRRTLSNAIMLAKQWGTEEEGPWKGAEVVYGDTDSIFIKLPGRSVKEAFAFGKAFCNAVTASNPPPVQLKLEKVYLGTLLQTKKKYCGMKYDSPDQNVPTFEAKGIETIRKDQCALTQKILRNALISIFKKSDLEGLREYLGRQWALINSGHLPVSDFILTGRVRSQYRGKVGPVQAALARRLAESDPGRKILHKERLPYVIVAAPGRNFKLRDCVLTPTELLAQWDSFTIHSEYYTTKHVNAALNRCFSLAPFKVDINSWYESAPKTRKRIHYWPVARSGNNSMISAYFGSDICNLCGRKSKSDGTGKSVICGDCRRDKKSAAFLSLQSLNDVQQKAQRLALICRSCNGCVENAGTYAAEKVKCRQKKNSSRLPLRSTGVVSPISICTCIDCPITYMRHEMRESEIETLALCNALRLLDS